MHAPLPVHPLTGLTAVGWRKARPGEDEELYPIWPILGGAPDEDDDQDDADDGGGDDDQDDDVGDSGDDDQDDAGDQDDADPDGADQLGDKGKRALASMKGKWRKERDQRKELERRLAKDDKGGGDDAVAKATAAATAKANTRILKAEIRAAAAKKLADPRDALRFLDLEQFEVDDEGEVDVEEIADAIETLIKDKPYLAAQSRQRFQGTGDGGAARKAGRPKQLTERDLKNMSAEQIVKAQEEGKLDDLLGA
ncbi:hypothetical protein ACKI1K_00230 [Streptomyces scabiei]|uniref:hypothetical protein n=1 Tax=Streptomyces scabiei TaxID=1930 RepID=UPI0029B77066|nr:hypothetical protein [Streptomyces scabiei]MDX2626486.1 hypothetical protein [Streptomyces scabiei]MDX3028590.1 hypothetical protein [Streptomyces scabiei]MDX3168283.1 hypothetical protein [Streptomyces scabiei]